MDLPMNLWGIASLDWLSKEKIMARAKKSSLATALKQNRPFVSLEQEVYLSILRTASELSYAVDQFFRQFDITQSQYNVLRILRGAGADGLCRNEISERMVTATPDMTRLLDRMEKAGWVTRKRAEDDRRQVSTHITKSGMELLARLEKPTADIVTPIFAGAAISDLKTVLKVNDQIRTKLS
jgi:DNA-binding MarR family transcriptional regulator